MKTIRVCTTGDYPPVTSYDAGTGTFSGEDIALIEEFARNQGLGLEFVLTTWPSLLADLCAEQFEIAVGGISRTEERQKLALVSRPLAITGKVALVRRGEEQRYGSLEAIDRPGTTVVEDRGGTNEQFARSHIKQARLVVLPDNHSPFDHLLDGTVDVMFTDSVEALYRQEIMPELCAVHPDRPYTRVEKVFLFRKDQGALRDRLDRWIDARSAIPRPFESLDVTPWCD
jgi:cyclohexadienyl dehydratase